MSLDNCHDPIEPDGWPRPRGYSNGMLAAHGRTLFVAGQIGWDSSEKLASPEVAGQFDRALGNVLEVVLAAGGGASDVARLTIYVVDKNAYAAARKEIGAAYRARMGPHYPAMTLVEVSNLLEPGALVEIEATAVIPDRRY